MARPCLQAGACGRLEGDLAAIVGQDLALSQAQAALCDHLQDPAPPRPLVLAVGAAFPFRALHGGQR